ncbi:RpiR family transcriptional regulator [Paraburkholderia steynii]|uniref:RpiR family transcriptional regulator n=1 Tax=Paraburkholderia steynii TaxID=1245441 RepID=A0A4R0X0V5_9BURK|nr:RpiR family transcriptional regulator [Paraburkholderia steynii]
MPTPHIASGQLESIAQGALRSLFESNGWKVAEAAQADRVPDFVLSDRKGKTYHAVLKVSKEGRSDRITPLFAQALLEARAHAQKSHRPAVIFWVEEATPSLLKRLQSFHLEYGNHEPFALIGAHGPLYANFPGLAMDWDSPNQVWMKVQFPLHAPPALVFSDSAQWMLKLLLASDLKRDGLINAPVSRYRSATELAHAANVSVMTATRLINALKAQDFIETAHTLHLVQRRRLAQQWKAVYHKTPVSVPMKFMTPAAPEAQLEKLLRKEPVVLGLFAAAHELGVGHVHGTVPTVFVMDLAQAQHFRGIRRALEGEQPDVVFQQHAFPRSMGQGAVMIGHRRVTDIFQTWLDVSSLPTRGAEQAEELENGVLAGVIGENT